MFDSQTAQTHMLPLAAQHTPCSLFRLSATHHDADHLYAPALTLQDSRTILMLPSFSDGPISFGLAIAERLSSSSSVTATNRTIGKFIHDHSNGKLIFLFMDVISNLVEITSYSINNRTIRTSISALFDHQKFLDAISTRQTAGLSMAAVLHSTIYLSRAEESCACQTKAEHTSINCTCIVAQSGFQSSKDYISKLKDSSYVQGSFYGSVSIALLTDGKEVFSKSLMCSSHLLVHKDAQRQHYMVEWALSSCAQKTDYNPLVAIASEIMNINRSCSFPSKAAALGDEMSDSLKLTQCESYSPESPVGIDTFASKLTCGVEIMGEPSVLKLQNEVGVESSSENMVDDGELDFEVHDLMKEASDEVGGMNSNEILQASNGALAEAIAVSVSGSASMSNLSTSEENTSYRSKSLAVLAPAAQVQSCTLEAETIMKAMEMERYEKVERRKARNRESAKRSNEKKKQHVTSLKAELEEVGKKESCLRAKEKLLREENTKLRIQMRREKLVI